MGDYNPKSKGLQTSWRGLQRRLPKTLSTFQITVVAGFVSLVILRSTVGIGMQNFTGVVRDSHATVSLDNGDREAHLRSLDQIDSIDLEPKRNLVQKAEEQLQKMQELVRTKVKERFVAGDDFDDEGREVVEEMKKVQQQQVKKKPEPKSIVNIEKVTEMKPDPKALEVEAVKEVKPEVEDVIVKTTVKGDGEKIVIEKKRQKVKEKFTSSDDLDGGEEAVVAMEDQDPEEEAKVMVTEPSKPVKKKRKAEEEKKVAADEKVKLATTEKEINGRREKQGRDMKADRSPEKEEALGLGRTLGKEKEVEDELEKPKSGEKKSEKVKKETTTSATTTQEPEESQGKASTQKEQQHLKEKKMKASEKKRVEETIVDLNSAVDGPINVTASKEKSAAQEKGADEAAVNSTTTTEPKEEEEVHERLNKEQAMEQMKKTIRRDDPNAFSLGPKISDWDEQRAEWMEKNPAMKVLDPHKPKVLLLSGSQPWPCVSSIGDHYLLKMIKNKVDYARIHKMEIFYNLAHLDKSMSHFWAKLPLIRKMMLIHPEVEWIFWMDSDAIFTDMVFEIPFEKYEKYNLVMWGYNDGIYEQQSWVACNTGVFFLRNNQWTLDLLETWSHMGPEGEIRNEAGDILSSYLTNRPFKMMADDQSAMVYLMLTRPELRDKIHLEWDYWLSGYWQDIVGNYEKYTAKSHPGAGGMDWPFTTHFTGCQPCTGHKHQDYKGNSCFDGMERAFNFGDNQVLKPFGFEHESLLGSVVRRIRNETTQPLGAVPIHNPWAVASFY